MGKFSMHGFTTPRRGKSALGFFCSRLILPAVSINGSSRAIVTKGEEDDDDADERDAVSPRYVSAFAGSSKVFEMLPAFSCISWACAFRAGDD